MTKRNNPWTIAIAAIAVIFAVYFSLPSFIALSGRPQPGQAFAREVPGWLPDNVLNLGLDLRGGVHLVLSVRTEEARKAELDLTSEAIVKALKKSGLGTATVREGPSVEVVLAPGADPEKARDLAVAAGKGIWDVAGRTESGFVLRPVERAEERLLRDAVAESVSVIRNRIDSWGVAEASIVPSGKDKIIVEVPGFSDPKALEELIGKTARLTFHLAKTPEEAEAIFAKADDNLGGAKLGTLLVRRENRFQAVRPEDRAEVEALLATKEAQAALPPGWEFRFGREESYPDVGRVVPIYVIESREALGGEYLDFAYVRPHGLEFVVFIEWNREGARIFERITGENVQKPLAILLDEQVISAPYITKRISRGAQPYIQGNFTRDEANKLAVMLKSGALPATIQIEERRYVGPSLGRDSIEKGVKAAVVGGVLVVVFMAVYYLAAGVAADLALCVNILLILAVLALFKATFTLPGIAGLILTIGMAVDGNVLIFERIREELRSGKTLYSAIDAGFKRAFVTILDANVTTLIAALVLLGFTTGPIRGFAVTLSVGICTSVYTAMVVTRVILVGLLSLSRAKTVRMLDAVGERRFDFVGARRYALTASAVLIILGMAWFAARGTANFGIDFNGGTVVQRQFQEPVDAAELREALGEAGLGKAVIQQFDAGRGVMVKVPLARGEDEGRVLAAIDSALSAKFGTNLLDPAVAGSVDYVGPAVGEQLKREALKAVAFALLGILIYTSMRFEFKFGVAAILALVHDVLFTLGALAVTGREINLPVVAAILTIVGYSLNDTIVVFDRIREDLKLMRKAGFAEIVNASINQTLSRTLLTSGTTLLVVLALFLLGGEAINDFAFTLLVGVMVGTYSSIFVASPILLAWSHGKRLKVRG